MDGNTFKEKMKLRIAEIETALKSYTAHEENPQSTIYDAMSYSLFAGGKRLRPMLLLEFAELCGGDKNTAMPYACAMEMIHTYSLIHDDLPAMDNDSLRRGKPTNHIRFGEAIAILAGDALLNKAFEVMTQYGAGAKNALRAMSVIARSSGTEGMIGGQVVDIESEDKKLKPEDLEYLNSLKTGAIIRSACTAGAIIAGADDEKISAADEFAKNLGAAFQIRDDILDITGDASVLGKPVGSDKEQHKNTSAYVLGIDGAEALVKSYSDAAKKALLPFGGDAEFLLCLTDYLANRER